MRLEVEIDVSFFFSSRRRHTRYIGDWSSDVCSSDLEVRRCSPKRFLTDEPNAVDDIVDEAALALKTLCQHEPLQLTVPSETLRFIARPISVAFEFEKCRSQNRIPSRLLIGFSLLHDRHAKVLRHCLPGGALVPPWVRMKFIRGDQVAGQERFSESSAQKVLRRCGRWSSLSANRHSAHGAKKFLLPCQSDTACKKMSAIH